MERLLHIASDSTLQSLAFNLGFNQFDACHELASEAVNLEGCFAFHKSLNLRFIQTGYDDHGISQLPARYGDLQEVGNRPFELSLILQGPSCQQVDAQPSRLIWRVACQKLIPSSWLRSWGRR